MPDLAREPSMEDILASIKRLIAEDGAATAPPPRVRRGPQPAANRSDEVLELTEAVAPAPAAFTGVTDELHESDFKEAPLPEPAVPEPEPSRPVVEQASQPAPDAPPTPPRAATRSVSVGPLVSEDAAMASRQALAALSSMIVTTAPGEDNTLEGLVRELLKPLLKEWLDAKLPEVVEGLVSREIARITGRSL